MLLLLSMLLILTLLPLLLSVLLLVLVLLLSVLRRRMLLFGLNLLVLAGLGLLRVVLFFALLLCVHRGNNSEKQRQDGRPGNSNYFHSITSTLALTYACSNASFQLLR
jgi:hypothetical protein